MSGSVNLTELRQGSAADLAAVSVIMQEAFDPRYGEAWTSAQCLGMLSMPGVWLTIARHGGIDMGFALSRETGEEAELLLLATRPTGRRRGVGGALLRATVAEAKLRGVKRIHLEVRAGNEAVLLYRREGFEKVGERRGYYRGRGSQLYDAETYAKYIA
ncbi:GNAT family N-acetyltransferase [Sphingomonas canadensis]|uniref:GNAT family N-acetyltransferase n=1 Tax=Sphingomonas canadensis TaxID=1219257 RepID=A0ABW3HDM4_9SPHN|nr:GNAT family N-acetyltransferase [Sphingomonas canadensis]MCW3838378.1 GNAT family N-acetyltransferase [Sphingomonas canadensis]